MGGSFTLHIVDCHFEVAIGIVTMMVVEQSVIV